MDKEDGKKGIQEPSSDQIFTTEGIEFRLSFHDGASLQVVFRLMI